MQIIGDLSKSFVRDHHWPANTHPCKHTNTHSHIYKNVCVCECVRICIYTWHGQVFGGTFPLNFHSDSCRRALPCEPQRSHVSYFAGNFIIFEGHEAQTPRKTHSRALSAALSHHIGLSGPACNSKHEAGSPAWAAAQLRGSCCAQKRKLRGPENACRLKKRARTRWRC